MSSTTYVFSVIYLLTHSVVNQQKESSFEFSRKNSNFHSKVVNSNYHFIKNQTKNSKNNTFFIKEKPQIKG